VTDKVRAVIAEDEPHARRSLLEYLQDAEWVEVVGEASDGRQAAALVDECRPQLLFLDIRMPELSGLEVVQRIRHMPEIVFTTAYDRFAMAAFELGALDYLLKPFGRQRFAVMLERARRRLGVAADDAERARHALGPSPLRRLFARNGDRAVPIPVDTIQRIQAQGDYSEVHCAAGRFLLHVSLGELVGRLDPERFCRIHRSHVVNIDAVEYLRDSGDRRLLVHMRDGAEITASRTASQELKRLVR
jgi:two-component system, LytTR family, response regulator